MRICYQIDEDVFLICLKSIIWNWFGYFKRARHRKQPSASTSTKTGEQPIEAPETVAPQRLHMGLRSPESPSTSSSGAQISIHCVVICCHFPYERCSKRSEDINNAVSYFIAKDMMPFWQKTYNGVKWCAQAKMCYIMTGLQCLQISFKRCKASIFYYYYYYYSCCFIWCVLCSYAVSLQQIIIWIWKYDVW